MVQEFLILPGSGNQRPQLQPDIRKLDKTVVAAGWQQLRTIDKTLEDRMLSVKELVGVTSRQGWLKRCDSRVSACKARIYVCNVPDATTAKTKRIAFESCRRMCSSARIRSSTSRCSVSKRMSLRMLLFARSRANQGYTMSDVQDAVPIFRTKLYHVKGMLGLINVLPLKLSNSIQQPLCLWQFQLLRKLQGYTRYQATHKK